MTTMTHRTTDGESDSETDTQLKALAVRIARDIATYDRLVVGEWVRPDTYQVRVESPVSPFEMNVRHYSKGREIADEETGRINVSVHHSGVSNGRVITTARDYGLDVVDVWQLKADLDREMGQHDEPALQFGLERVE